MHVGSLQHRFIQAAREAFAGFLCEADLRDYLVKRYEDEVGMDVINKAIKIAPKYAERIIIWQRDGRLDFTDEELLLDIKNDLKAFDRIKKIDTFKEQAEDEWNHLLKDRDPADINSYKSYEDFYAVIEDLKDVKSKKEEQREKIQEGYSVVAEEGRYKLFEITNAEASVALCKGMGWCTHAPREAKEYTDRGPLYMVVHDRDGPEYLAHFETNTLQDASRQDVRPGDLPADVYNLFEEADLEDGLEVMGRPTEEEQRETWIGNSIEEIRNELRGYGDLDLPELDLPEGLYSDRNIANRMAGEIFDWLVRTYPDLAEWELDDEGYPYALSPSREHYIAALTALGYLEMTEEERRKRGPPGPGYWQEPGYDPEKAYWWSQYEEQMPLGLQARYLRAVREHYAGFFCEADLRDYLIQDYEEKVGAAIIDKAIEIAPKYAERIVIWNMRDESMDITTRLWEDRMRNVLKKFEDIKKLKEFKEGAKEYGVFFKGNPSDINSYKNWDDFYTVVGGLENVKSRADTLRDKIQEGYTQLAEESGWSVYELTNQEATTALCKNLGWCVKDPKFGKDYLEEGPLHLIVEGKSPEYLIHLQGVSGTPEMQDRDRSEVTWDDLPTGAQVVLEKAMMAGIVEELFPGEAAAEEAEEARQEAEEARQEENYQSSVNETWNHLDREYSDISTAPDWNDVMVRLEGRPYYMEYDRESGDAVEPDRSQVIEVLAELELLDEEVIWATADEGTTARIRERAQTTGQQLTTWKEWTQGPLVREDVPNDFDEQIFNWLLQNYPDQVRDDSLFDAAEDPTGVLPDSEYIALAAMNLGFATPQAVQIYNIVFAPEEEPPTGPAYYEQPGYVPPPEGFVSPYEEQPELGLQASKLALALLQGELVA